MSSRTAFVGAAALACVFALLTSGCTSGNKAGTADEKTTSAPVTDASGSRPPDAGALKAVSLPDLSRMDESVKEQLREGYASLQEKMTSPKTPPLELGNAYGEMGKLFMAVEFLDEAESCYLNARALAKDDTRWPYYLAHLYRLRGDSARAAELLEQVLNLRPDDVQSLLWLGEVYLVQGRPEAAEPLLSKALSLQPRSVAALSGLGRAALARKDYARAVQHLEGALALDPQAASVHYPLATAYRALGDVAKADAHLLLRQRGDFEIGPADPMLQELAELVRSGLGYELRGMRALASGDWAGAAASFRKGIELTPENPALWHRLGTALFQMGDARGAVEQFEEALRRSPTFAKAHYSLGVLLQASGHDKEAIERFSAAVRYEPTYIEARLRLAAVLRRTGRLREALAQYQQVINVAREVGGDPRVAEAPFGYAITLVRLRRYREARDMLAEALKTYPDQPVYTHALARLLAAAPDSLVRDGPRAMALMQALSDEQRRVDTGETMAMTLAELGRYDEAAAWQREAIAAAKQGGRADSVQRMTERLRAYERRAPWRSDDPIEYDLSANPS